jgi:hypothetical protein
MNIEESIIKNRDGQPSPFVKADGRWYYIETKPSLLALGIAIFQPLLDDLQEDWEAMGKHKSYVSADEASGREKAILEDCTTDAGVVALAAKFNQLAEADQLAEGPLTA